MKKLLLTISLVLACALPALAKPLHLNPVGPAFACKSIAHAEHCVVINVSGYEVATTLTIPNSFTANTPAVAAQVNQNFNTIASWANGNVDNSNIGASGIYASQIIPVSTGTATFGGAQQYHFSTILNTDGGLVSTVASDANVPVTVQGHSATQSVDLQDWKRSSGGSLLDAIGAHGDATFSVDADASTPLIVDGHSATQSAAVVRIFQSPAGTELFKVNPTGDAQVCPLVNTLNTCGRIAPAYTAAGATVAGTWHTVTWTAGGTFTGNCLNDTICTFSVSQIQNFTNAAVFTAPPSCSGSATVGGIIVMAVGSTTTGSESIMNQTGGTINAGTGATILMQCSGV